MVNDGPNDGTYGEVPKDFPRTQINGAVPGAQPKFLATLFEGRFYMAGCTPPEIAERWRICEDLALQLAEASIKSKNGKRAQMTDNEILNQYYDRLIQTRWTSLEEARWVIKRAAAMLVWNVELPS